jgi:glycosyltransferase involved in cell wall biosynthesis
VTILIDATTAQHARGIRTVIEGVLSGLRPDDGVVVAAPPNLEVQPGLSTRRVPLARTRGGRLAYQRLLLPFDRTARGGVDRVLLLDSYLPLIRPRGAVRYAALVHDVLPLTHPQLWPAAERAVKRTAFSSLRRGGAQLFTSTAHNAQAVRGLLGVEPEVVPFGCGQLRDEDADAACAAELPRQEPYLLYVGALEPRKNVHAAIDAFEAVSGDYPEHRLILAGNGEESFVHALDRRIAESREGGRIERREGSTREEILALIAHANALVFPSRAEGFGLPVLEALALGTPVAASDIPEIRTWAGDVVALAAPDSRAEWMATVVQALSLDDEGRRRGQSFARAFRWRPCAQALIGF